jgi:hypothetical protein
MLEARILIIVTSIPLGFGSNLGLSLSCQAAGSHLGACRERYGHRRWTVDRDPALG